MGEASDFESSATNIDTNTYNNSILIYEKIGIWNFQSFVFRYLCLVHPVFFSPSGFIVHCYNKGLYLFGYFVVTWKLGTDDDANIFYYLIPLLSFLNVGTWDNSKLATFGWRTERYSSNKFKSTREGGRFEKVQSREDE